ncbi:MAG: hypothetical protein IJ397_00370 [Lachnospiraceae bacterium]|nr:hypothetical protein [Lachnospiraceae bacterium]
MLNKCWKRLAVVLAVGSMLVVGLVGCNGAEVPEAEVIESEVVSESVSEEVSEEVTSEAESESVEEEAGGVEYVNYANKVELMTYLEELNQTTIIWYNFSIGTEQAIIPNGEKYTLEGDNSVTVISTNNNIVDIRANVDYIDTLKSESKENQWAIYVETTGTDLEVSFTVVYEDGTEEDFTIYITKEGE